MELCSAVLGLLALISIYTALSSSGMKGWIGNSIGVVEVRGLARVDHQNGQ